MIHESVVPVRPLPEKVTTEFADIACELDKKGRLGLPGEAATA